MIKDFESIKKEFLKTLESLNYSPNSLRAYSCDLATLSDPSRESILSALEGLSGRSRNRRLYTFQKFIKYASKYGIQSAIQDLGSARVEKKLPRIPEIDLVAVETTRKLKHKLILKLLVEAGLRASELSKLENGDAYEDSEGYWVKVRQGKGKKDRFVPLHKDTYESLKGFLVESKKLPKSADIFYLTRKYLNCSPHDLRRFCATKLAEAGMSSLALKDFFGWSSIVTAENYVRISKKALYKEFERCSV